MSTPRDFPIVVAPTQSVQPQPLPATEALPVPQPAGSVLCTTLEELRSQTGLDWTRVGGPSTGENCTYAYNTADYSYDPMPLLAGWMTTTAQEDGLVHVRKGDGSTVRSKATTIRLLTLNVGLTSDLQTTLTKEYAPSAGYDPSIVICDDCSGTSSFTPAASPAAPSVTGFNCSPIDGGYVCKANPPANFVVPFGWKAYAGVTPQWYPSGTDLGPQSQVSLYPQ
ncbi:MAG: hypothetical protein WC894_01040 [Patescibacteria group bacterium]